MVWCRACKIYHALLPDFLTPKKHYSGNEIESVIIDSANEQPNEIETKASEITVRRWIKQIGERIIKAIEIIKNLFMEKGLKASELSIKPGPGYDELEQLLEKAPEKLKYSGNKLGLANIWLRRHSMANYI